MSTQAPVQAWCTFRLGGRLYGVPVDRVREVLRAAPITPVPQAPAAVRGLLHLRGAIVTVIDLAVVLGLPRPAQCSRPHVVIGDGERTLSLAVDAIGDVQRHAHEEMQPSPDTLPAGERGLIAGVIPREGELLLALHLDAVIHRAFDSPGGPRRRQGERDCA